MHRSGYAQPVEPSAVASPVHFRPRTFPAQNTSGPEHFRTRTLPDRVISGPGLLPSPRQFWPASPLGYSETGRWVRLLVTRQSLAGGFRRLPHARHPEPLGTRPRKRRRPRSRRPLRAGPEALSTLAERRSRATALVRRFKDFPLLTLSGTGVRVRDEVAPLGLDGAGTPARTNTKEPRGPREESGNVPLLLTYGLGIRREGGCTGCQARRAGRAGRPRFRG